MARRYESRVLSAGSSITVAASTAWTNPTNREEPAAVHAHADGNLIGTLVGDTNPTTFVVAGGLMYPYAFKSLEATNAVQVTILYN